ncbi:hypothetical protein DPMN_130396 [Dreissena polymorpha]|uniref:PKD/REJ-like domain-containing protein n=1 Tax=Dreissena polymorpha TaxID=45954 RepID=A0A9D4H7P5_DREPO|nr:hypothetical protein DPMN_130396 [Dreissena polymorpha]
MELTNSASNCTPEIYWSITKSNTTKTISEITTEYTDITFQQPNTSVLKLDKGYLEQGDFIVCLDVKFPSAGPSHWVSDCMMLRVVLPELIAYISGGEFRTISYGDVVIIDASMSRDPMQNISTINETLEVLWSVTRYVDASTIDAFQANTAPIPQTSTYHKIQNGSDYGLRLDTNLFSSGENLLVSFTLSRGSRRSTVHQVLQMVANAAPLSLR